MMVIVSRVTLSLGYGLQFCIKRQIARVATSKRRGDLMLWNNTFDIIGMASGPALVGLGIRLFTYDTVDASASSSSSASTMATATEATTSTSTMQTLAARATLMMVETQGAPPHKPPHADSDADTTSKLMVPAILLLVVVTLNLLAILYSDIEEPFFEDGSGAPIVDTPSETTPLTAAGASKSGGQAYDTGKADAAEAGSVAAGDSSLAEAAEARGARAHPLARRDRRRGSRAPCSSPASPIPSRGSSYATHMRAPWWWCTRRPTSSPTASRG